MSTTIVVILLIAVIIVISLVFNYIGYRNMKKRKQTLLEKFREAGRLYSLSFSAQEVFKDCIIGLDGVNRKLLLIVREENDFFIKMIPLDDIRYCSVKKIFCGYHDNVLHKTITTEQADRIILVIELKDSGTLLQLPLYDHTGNHISEYFLMERKAGYWVSVLNKMLFNREKRYA